MHGAKNFPFRKEQSDLDIDLPDGCTDGLYLSQLQAALAQLEARCSPDVVFYLAGADPHEGDRLGRLKLSFEGLQERDRMVFEWAWRKRVPLAMAMAGGYGKEIADTVQVQINTFSQALTAWERWQNQQP
jgi:acetoin utilization deacetylase AcuC-like enzyme